MEIKNSESVLKIDLLDERQKIRQFTEMAINQHPINNYGILGTSPNVFTTNFIIKMPIIFYKDFIVLMKIIYQKS